MKKFFSKIDKKKLLHIVSENRSKDISRLDLTNPNLPLQVSRINLRNSTTKPHFHKKKIIPQIEVETNECWIILNGSVKISLFDIDKKKIANLTLRKGSILITLSGGHSIDNTSKDSELAEIKLGPYKKNDLEYY